VQAGASEAGRKLAAETAEVVFAGVNNFAAAKAYRSDVHARMRAFNRDPALLKVMPGAFVVVGDTVASAHAKKAKLDGLVHAESAMATLSAQLGFDVSTLDIDSPLPDDLPETNASRGGRQMLIDKAKAENMSVRQLAQYVGGSFGALEIIGTAQTIADEMEKWLMEGACDGFNILFPYLPQGLDDFVDQVVPELQRRGLFRREYTGRTLREHLELPRPKNRFFD
jgi:alkanesulfonate monooxygenase SsuD/methylene tetrahydromethanopterin reductase-like flavin-dependent oxidoreductase (luciferase family)